MYKITNTWSIFVSGTIQSDAKKIFVPQAKVNKCNHHHWSARIVFPKFHFDVPSFQIENSSRGWGVPGEWKHFNR
jgi:hypothetical protein